MANILETVVFADGETANTQQATGTQTAADPNACSYYRIVILYDDKTAKKERKRNKGND